MKPPKILVFSGDNDAVCGTQGTLTWIFSLGLNVTDYWKAWRFNDPLYGERLGGYYTKVGEKRGMSSTINQSIKTFSRSNAI